MPRQHLFRSLFGAQGFRTLGCLLLSCLLFAPEALAQQRAGEAAPPDERAERLTERMDQKLELSDQQREEIHEINLDFMYGVEEVKAEIDKEQSRSKRRGELRSLIKELNQERDQRTRAVLEPAQMEPYEAMKEAFRKRMRERRRGRSPRPSSE